MSYTKQDKKITRTLLCKKCKQANSYATEYHIVHNRKIAICLHLLQKYHIKSISEKLQELEAKRKQKTLIN